MKVFNLGCIHGHVFEGWFASEDDYQSQVQRHLVDCPVCGSEDIQKRPSAPRLNLGAATPPSQTPAAPAAVQDALQAAWLALSKKIVAETEDVGDAFPREARRIHEGEAPIRGIRGKATPEQTMELIEDGVPVLPLSLPNPSKKTLH